jgi:two-component system, OmpR family, sensor kinase
MSPMACFVAPGRQHGGRMSLRTRLVVATVALTAVALALFASAVTAAYRRSELRALDDQLISAIPSILRDLDDGGAERGPGPPLAIPAGYVAELRRNGAVVSSIRDDTATSTPDLAAVVEPVAGGDPTFTTVDSATGSGAWRVIADPVEQRDAVSIAVVAVPLSGVSSSVNRLVLLQVVAGAALLGVLGLGSALLLRRGLRPLETMATSAAAITAGDLDRRVTPADTRSEVGQLGLALNTMLADIESAFAERDATEAKLRRFLADASHELRTPLTSIQGFAELGVLGRNGAIDQQLAFTRIQDESARMRRLIDDLLTLARLDEQRPRGTEPIDMSVVAADSATAAHATAPDRPVSLDAPAPAVVVGDADLLRRAVENLLTNALRHTPPGTPIDVATRSNGTGVEVTVRDHGSGFPPDDLDRIFDRFWQADRARVGEGSGLGLAIVSAIVAEHGGSVVATNHRDGGAVVTLRLPSPATA